MLLNDSVICSGEGDQQNGIGNEQVQMACGAVVEVAEGLICSLKCFLNGKSILFELSILGVETMADYCKFLYLNT